MLDDVLRSGKATDEAVADICWRRGNDIRAGVRNVAYAEGLGRTYSEGSKNKNKSVGRRQRQAKSDLDLVRGAQWTCGTCGRVEGEFSPGDRIALGCLPK